MNSFIENQYKFGTIALKTNVSKTPQEIYNLYKERREIEQSFDFLKNLLEQDKSFMQNEKSLETWAFINHISLMLNYKIYNLLREKKQLSNFSVADFLSHLKYIFKVKINDTWYLSETTRKTRVFLDKININIT
jgi:transposase